MLASEPVGGRSQVTELPCSVHRMVDSAADECLLGPIAVARRSVCQHL